MSSRWTKSNVRSKKVQRAVVWIAFIPRLGRLIAYHIGHEGTHSAMVLYRLATQAARRITHNLYRRQFLLWAGFQTQCVKEPHDEKSTALPDEASNSSIRDNLARFNRRSKRFSKKRDMLEITLTLFFNRHLVESPK
jgi:IS1 family transposase